MVGHPQRVLGNASAVALGRDVTIHSGIIFEALAPAGQVVIRIGDGCYVGYRSRFVAVNGIVMGDRSCIGHNVTLSDTVHDYKNDASGAPWEAALKVGRPLEIGEEAWVGNNVVIAGGVRIGTRAIVGANAFVNQDVPPDTVVVGGPARAVRRRRSDGSWELLVPSDALNLGLPPDESASSSA